MSFKSLPILIGYNDTNVNLKNTGATLLFTQPNTQSSYFPFRIRVFSGNVSGITGAPTISIGTNASSYNNILAATALTGLTTAGTYIDYAPTYPLAPIAFNTSVFVNVTIGATGTTFGARIAIYMDSGS